MGSQDDIIKKPRSINIYDTKKLQQLARCAQDPKYFMEEFIWVQHAIHGRLKITLFDYQKDMLNTIHDNRYSILLTSRQMGKSTIVGLYLLWYAMFNADSTILIVANNAQQALENMQTIRFAYEEIPDHIRAGAASYNKGSIEFDNGSRIISRATTSSSGRGLAITILYADELAFVKPQSLAEEFWTAIQPTLSTGGKCIVTSTPNGDNDLFSRLWFGANDFFNANGQPIPGGVGKNGFKGYLAPWWFHPHRDESWAGHQRQSLGEEKFKREMCCEFITAEETLITSMHLQGLTPKNPTKEDGLIRWFSDPLPNRVYLISLDPAVGTGGDRAAIQVFELPDMKQVAEWCDNTSPPKMQVETLMKILKYIKNTLSEDLSQKENPDNNIYWTYENNGVGEAITAIIGEVGIERFPGYFISEPKRPGRNRSKKGLVTSNKPKITACTKLKSLIESNNIIICSNPLIQELKTYIRKGAGFEHKSGYRDDLVSSTLLCLRLADIIKDFDPNITEKLREVIELEEDESIPLPFIMSLGG